MIRLANLESRFTDLSPESLILNFENEKEKEQLLEKLKEALPPKIPNGEGDSKQNRIIPRIKDLTAYANYYSAHAFLTKPCQKIQTGTLSEIATPSFGNSSPPILDIISWCFPDALLHHDPEMQALIVGVEMCDFEALSPIYEGKWFHTLRRLSLSQLYQHQLRASLCKRQSLEVFANDLNCIVKDVTNIKIQVKITKMFDFVYSRRSWFLRKDACTQLSISLQNLGLNDVQLNLLKTCLWSALALCGVDIDLFPKLSPNSSNALNLTVDSVRTNHLYSLLVVQYALTSQWKPNLQSREVLKTLVEKCCGKTPLSPGLKSMFFNIFDEIVVLYSKNKDFDAIAFIFDGQWRNTLVIELFSLHIHPTVPACLLEQQSHAQLALAVSSLFVNPHEQVVKGHHDSFHFAALSGEFNITFRTVSNFFYCFLDEVPRLMTKKFSFNLDKGVGPHLAFSHVFNLLPGKLQRSNFLLYSWFYMENHFFNLPDRLELILTMCLEEYIAEERKIPHVSGNMTVESVWKMTDSEVLNICSQKVSERQDRPLFSSENFEELRALEVDTSSLYLSSKKGPENHSNKKAKQQSRKKQGKKKPPTKAAKKTLNKAKTKPNDKCKAQSVSKTTDAAELEETEKIVNKESESSSESEPIQNLHPDDNMKLLDESQNENNYDLSVEPTKDLQDDKGNKIIANSQENDSSDGVSNTESNAHSDSTTKSSIMDKFKEVQIVASENGSIDFRDLFDHDEEFLAFDLELTGIGELRGPNGPPTFGERVKTVKANSIVQVGLLFMRRVAGTNPDLIQLEQASNVYKISVCKEQNPNNVKFQKESLAYLQEHGFSLETWRNTAIPQSQLMKVWEMMQKKTLIIHNGLVDLMHFVQALDISFDCTNEVQLRTLLMKWSIKFYDSRVHMANKFGSVNPQLGELAKQFLKLENATLHDAACDAFITGQLVIRCGPLEKKNLCILNEFKNIEESEEVKVVAADTTKDSSHLPVQIQSRPSHFSNYRNRYQRRPPQQDSSHQSNSSSSSQYIANPNEVQHQYHSYPQYDYYQTYPQYNYYQTYPQYYNPYQVGYYPVRIPPNNQ